MNFEILQLWDLPMAELTGIVSKFGGIHEKKVTN